MSPPSSPETWMNIWANYGNMVLPDVIYILYFRIALPSALYSVFLGKWACEWSQMASSRRLTQLKK